MKKLIRDYLKTSRLLTDGAMGTYYNRINNEDCQYCELENIEHPERIEKIHREYIEAGAMLIRTNTFAANSLALNCDIETRDNIIKAGIDIAVRASQGNAFVAGDIGPISYNGNYDEETVIEEYKSLIDTFLRYEIDLIMFETFADVELIKELVSYIREKSDIFIMANFCVNKYGYTSNGMSIERLMQELDGIDNLDACGLNCGIGSGHMLSIVDSLKFPKNKFFACMPNAGYPEQFQNRMVFIDNIAYFDDNMTKISANGVDIIGGCCGTTPAYISRLYASYVSTPIKKMEYVLKSFEKADIKVVDNEFLQSVQSKKKTIAVELDPPFDADYSKILGCAEKIKEIGADIITFADSPMGRSRTDSVLMSVKIQQEIGINVCPHICCRDKNMIAIRSILLGAHMHNIRNLLLVTGDPVPSVSRSSITGVFDYNSIQLMNFVKELNGEIFSSEPFVYGGALNVSLGKPDKIIERMKKKIDAGASYFLTQPVYSKDAIERMHYIKDKTGANILCGIMPLVSFRNANFIKNEFIGIDVPEEIVARYHENMSKTEGEITGSLIAKEIIEQVDDCCDGYYYMLPFNRVSILERIYNK